MGRLEKVLVGAVVAMYLGLLALLLRLGHGPAAVLAFLVIITKASLFYGLMRNAANMGTGARRRSTHVTALLQGRST